LCFVIFFPYTTKVTITVVSATGSGKTSLSAFDNALQHAGVYNYNLIPLSSVIPTGAKITKAKHFRSDPKECGFRLYVVKAEMRATDPEKAIAAGVGWYMLKTGAGVFVEHEIEGLTTKSVQDALKERIYSSLSDLCTFRGEKFHTSKTGISLAASAPSPEPRCALTLAVYKAEPW
jgi:arginine decarboxylase